jgi:cation diffusion facilitator family transporter
MRWTRNYTPQPKQDFLYKQAMIITVVGNIVLATSKALIAYVSGSVSLYADAANSVSDVVYSLLMVFGLYVSQRPPDISHPQGHSRFEPLVGLMVTASMTFAGFEAARASWVRFMAGGLAVEPGLPTLVLLASAAVKLAMFLRIRWIASQLASPALNTTAQDNLSDVLTSIAAFIGALGSKFIHPLADPLGGFLVSAWIFRAVWRAARDNLGFLTGAGADQELREQLVHEASLVPGVLGVHHLMTEYAGPRLVVDLHVNVDGAMTLHAAHVISDAVIERLETFPDVDRVYVHVEPEGFD